MLNPCSSVTLIFSVSQVSYLILQAVLVIQQKHKDSFRLRVEASLH